MSKLKSFTVKMRCQIIKIVDCEAPSEEAIRHESDVWAYATNELEVDQEDWEILSVKEDK